MSDQTANTEVLRLQALQALGITVYHPRFRLPGAKPSVQGPWSGIGEGATPASAEATRVAPPERAIEKTAEKIAGKTQPPAAPQRPSLRVESAPVAKAATPVAATPSPRAAENTQPAVQNFQLLFMQVDDDLAIVNQVPALARPQLQEKQLLLLTNLLRWLGKNAPAQSPRVFRWPLPGLEHMAASMDPATSLLHFLEQASSERGFRFLLQLGPLSAVAPAASAWQGFATHSLDEMLALPSLKREVWQTLLPLHELLHARR